MKNEIRLFLPKVVADDITTRLTNETSWLIIKPITNLFKKGTPFISWHLITTHRKKELKHIRNVTENTGIQNVSSRPISGIIVSN